MSITKWSKTEEQGYEVLQGENAFICVRLVPERGGKIISLVNKRTGTEWIHRTERPWTALRNGMNWDDGDQGGWDEMFPTIEACSCPDEPWQDKRFPDHGEVWCMPWTYAIEGESLFLQVEGRQIPYRFGKRISLSGSELLLEYEVENPTRHLFSYLWAAHPLLNIRAGMKLEVPPSLNEIEIAYSHGERLGRLSDLNRFPLAEGRNGETVDLSILEEKDKNAGEKYYFTGKLQEGNVRLTDPMSGESMMYRFAPGEVPYLAIWAHYGAFGDYTFAVEPATGYMDSVHRAHELGKVKQVLPGGTNRWALRVELGISRIKGN
ncbi:DUF5107 domain-containing protein [Paenibacillus glycanilyticus]|uniref:DUF5107 domain-containing protein n=1 Tax=Paenibacillus glycanilyticus TaxID=126569 RepID=A0ABQ6G712_9BACL|nr:DUF5107 domain-containing protein [Paenibacillus glycanilyticus]GLX66342.1 hypothetical protein MU1_06860 [Paenibacillus glycanilyticus]